MRAFGRTLRTVSAKVVRHNEYTLAMDPHNNALGLGGWNLPFIQYLDLTTNTSGCTTSLGAFDRCSLLTYLRISCAGASNLTDQSQITDLLRARAPVWHLPKLKTLCLYQTIVLLFNYDSLLNMPNLETLLVGTWVNCDEAVVAPFPPSRIWDVSEQQVGTADNGQDISTDIARITILRAPVYLMSPRVKHGPTTGNCRNYEKWTCGGSPAMCSASIGSSTAPNSSLLVLNELQKRIVVCHSGNRPMDHIPSESEAGPTSKSMQQGYDMPLYKSPLKSLYLKGPWVMSDSDLYEVLTDYTPNLMTFHVERLCRLESRLVRGFPGDP